MFFFAGVLGENHPPLANVVDVGCNPEPRLRRPVSDHLPEFLRKHAIEAQMRWCLRLLITEHAIIVVWPAPCSKIVRR